MFVTDRESFTGYVSGSERRFEMVILAVLFVVIAVLAAYDAAAVGWGVDSRDSMPDTRRR